jgi:dTDP-4-amino-4,6-dideoxygalactose transaminase
MIAATPVSSRNIPLLDLKAQHRSIRVEVLAEVTRVIDSQKFILGDDVKSLESEIADYCSTKHAIGCASGSDALLLALMSLEIGPGDEVLTSPYTFFATVGAICRLGATPVLADIDSDTFNLDVAKVA